MNARFEALKLDVPLPPSHEYHDDGLVDSIAEHTDRLRERYGLAERPDSEETAARYVFARDKEGVTHHHVFCLNLEGHNPLQIILQGHEETHALAQLGRLDLLEDALLRGNVYLNLRRTNNQELVANIGGVHALRSRGIPPQFMRNHVTVLGDSFGDALDAFDEYRISRFRAKLIRTGKDLRMFAELFY